MSSSMNRFRNEFSIKFAKLMEVRLPIWKEIQANNIHSLYSIKSIGFYIFISLFGFVPGKNEHAYDLTLHCLVAAVCFIVAVIINIQTTNKTYQKHIKSTLFNELLQVFGNNIKYANYSSSSIIENLKNSKINKKDISNLITEMEESYENNIKIPTSVFENCKLYNHSITERSDDDIFFGNYLDVKFIINETDFGYETRDSKGRRHYHSLFKGVAMRFNMNKQIKARVLIKSKGILNNAPSGFEKVELESSDFAKKYNVFVQKTNDGSGQIEARYMLNTAFMDRLLQIQTSFNINNMNCSIYGDDLLVMLSTNRDLFEMNHLFGKIDDITQYRHLFEEFASVLSFIEVLNLASKTKL